MKAAEIEDIRWPKDRDKAKRLQERLSGSIILTPFPGNPRYIAGVDSAFFGDNIISVACLFDFPGLTLIEQKSVIRKVAFPYIPGLLFFREGPAVIEAIQALEKKPDLIIFDGQGIAHPRGLGIASSVGVLLDIPSIGCAKSRLVGQYEDPGFKKGSRTPLIYEGRVIGSVVRTRDGVAPVFVSPGHRIDIEGSVKFVLRCAPRYRLPEPVRCADMLSKRLKPAIKE